MPGENCTLLFNVMIDGNFLILELLMERFLIEN